MAKKPQKTDVSATVALRDVMVDGIAFAAGEEITGVAPDQLAIAVRLGAAGVGPAADESAFFDE